MWMAESAFVATQTGVGTIEDDTFVGSGILLDADGTFEAGGSLSASLGGGDSSIDLSSDGVWVEGDTTVDGTLGTSGLATLNSGQVDTTLDVDGATTLNDGLEGDPGRHG